jgi:hypothetical protein
VRLGRLGAGPQASGEKPAMVAASYYLLFESPALPSRSMAPRTPQVRIARHSSPIPMRRRARDELLNYDR